MGTPRRFLAPLAVAVTWTAAARADDPAGPGQSDLEKWLASEPAAADVSKAPEAPEAPPPPPRRHGFVVESSLGVMGHLGPLRHVTATQPWTRVGFGWEPTRWLMLLVQGDAAFGSTEYAKPPPEPRGFALVGASGALRFGAQPFEAVGFFLQGEIGGATVTNDVLASYGFADADSLQAYFGGLLGLEWYQVSPHLALSLQGGVRSYAMGLSRAVGGGTPVAWLGAGGLKYTF